MAGTQCKDEIAKFCANRQHGGGAMHTCLNQHMSELSENRKTALKRMGNMGNTDHMGNSGHMGGQGGGMGSMH